jgi:lysine 6-dehydrogenase
MKVVILGAGLVGGPMAIDLSKESKYKVTSVDLNEESLDKLKEYPSITKLKRDLADSTTVKTLVKDYDIVINAVPGFMGFQTLKSIIEAKKDVVDIAFFAEDPFLLDKLAKENGVTAVVDCGVAPGMSNVLIGYADSMLDKTEKVIIYVGGLPEVRQWPYEYKAGFSPLDVIEEYVRPARYVENGKLVVKPALSEPEYINFPRIGTLEAFNSDGLRTLTTTIDAPNKIEKTLRYPGHIEKMAILRETGFFNKEAIEVNGKMIRPLDVTAKLLFPKWKLEEGEVDFTVLRVIIEGEKSGKQIQYQYDMFDTYDADTKTHSMARTTGYTATSTIRMISEGLYTRKGVSAPEFIGRQKECKDYLLNLLNDRGVLYRETIKEIE